MPFELSSDKLYRVGGACPLDGRTSWTPADARGFQQANCYVLMGNQGPMVIDPGPAYVRQGVLSGLRSLIPDKADVEIFLTRFNNDSIGNLGVIADVFNVTTVYCSPILPPLDGFDNLGSDPVEVVPDESRLEVIHATLRILATFWGYEEETKTLFTSDAFTHVTNEAPDGPLLLDSLDDDPTTIADVRGHLDATFTWLDDADTWPIADGLRAIFDDREIETIAPARGRILRGEEVVARHLAMVLDVLSPAVREDAA